MSMPKRGIDLLTNRFGSLKIALECAISSSFRCGAAGFAFQWSLIRATSQRIRTFKSRSELPGLLDLLA